MRTLLLLLLAAVACADDEGKACATYACFNSVVVELASPRPAYELAVRFGDVERTVTCPHEDREPIDGVDLLCESASFELVFAMGPEMAGVAFDEPLATIEVTITAGAESGSQVVELGPPDLAGSDHCHDCSLRTATLEELR